MLRCQEEVLQERARAQSVPEQAGGPPDPVLEQQLEEHRSHAEALTKALQVARAQSEELLQQKSARILHLEQSSEAKIAALQAEVGRLRTRPSAPAIRAPPAPRPAGVEVSAEERRRLGDPSLTDA